MNKTFTCLTAIILFSTSVQAQITTDAYGNVGIGINSPLSKLQVVGTFLTGGGYANIDPSGGNKLSFIENTGEMLTGWNRTAGSGETDFISNQGAGNTGGFAFYNHDNGGNEKQLMWIKGDGSVGIGTSSTYSYMFAVNGSAVALSMTVKAYVNWPDYVFKPAYNLTPLSELKNYIDQHQHLPEIPSAAEIEKDGLNLGEINKLLIKKVEELTLYMIKLQEENTQLNKKQQEQFAAQEKEIKELKNKVMELSKNN